MAEAFLKQLAGNIYDVESAGIEKGILNPNVIKVMLESGIDISANKTKEVFDFVKQGKSFQAVITVCDAANAERCPIFPGTVKRMGWSFTDPSAFTGTEEDILEHTRKVRDEIKVQVEQFIKEANEIKFWMPQ